MDESIRRLERQAAMGDTTAQEILLQEKLRSGHLELRHISIFAQLGDPIALRLYDEFPINPHDVYRIEDVRMDTGIARHIMLLSLRALNTRDQEDLHRRSVWASVSVAARNLLYPLIYVCSYLWHNPSADSYQALVAGYDLVKQLGMTFRVESPRHAKPNERLLPGVGLHAIMGLGDDYKFLAIPICEGLVQHDGWWRIRDSAMLSLIDIIEDVEELTLPFQYKKFLVDTLTPIIEPRTREPRTREEECSLALEQDPDARATARIALEMLEGLEI